MSDTINGKSPCYDGGSFRLYVSDITFKGDAKDHWIGYLSLKVGNHWVSAGSSTSDSKEKAIKALLNIHYDYYKCFTNELPPYIRPAAPGISSIDYTIEGFAKDLANGKE